MRPSMWKMVVHYQLYDGTLEGNNLLVYRVNVYRSRQKSSVNGGGGFCTDSLTKNQKGRNKCAHCYFISHLGVLKRDLPPISAARE